MYFQNTKDCFLLEPCKDLNIKYISFWYVLIAVLWISAAIAREYYGEKGRVQGDCEEALNGGKLSAGASKDGLAKGREKALPSSKPLMLRTGFEVNE